MIIIQSVEFMKLDREKLTSDDNKSEVSLKELSKSNKTYLPNEKINKNDVISND